MAGKSSDDFTEENDIFIFKESKRYTGEKTGKFKYYGFEESKEAMEELMTEIEESKGDGDILKVGVNISKYVKAKKSGSLVERVKEAMREKDYTIFTQPYVLNIVGIRNKTREANKFDDKMVVFYYDDKGEEVVASKNGEKDYWDITTDPGYTYMNYVEEKNLYKINKIEKKLKDKMTPKQLKAYEERNELDLTENNLKNVLEPEEKSDWYKYGRRMYPQGAGILKEGQYVDCFCIDYHGSKNPYLAICQRHSGRAELTVYRDKNKDNILNTNVKTETGYFHLDIHKTSKNSKNKQEDVYNISAACQVCADPKEFDKLMSLAVQQYKKQGIKGKSELERGKNARYTYTLLLEEELE